MIPKNTLEKLNLLPASAAPFLSFIQSNHKPLSEEYTHLPSEYNDYIYIGSDDIGNPICLKLSDEKIHNPDHENNFTPSYMNLNINHLLEFLEIYKGHIETILTEFGDDAFIESQYPVERISRLEEKFKATDPEAIEDNTFRKFVLVTDKANWEYEH